MRSLILLSLFMILPLRLYAENAEVDMASVKNPFISQLPQAIEPVEAPAPAPVSQEPVALEPVKVQEVKVTPPSLKVQGVVWGKDVQQAIINDQIVSPGETVSGAKLVSVSKSQIQVLYQGKTFTFEVE